MAPLSRFRSLFPIARNSSFTYKGLLGGCEAGSVRELESASSSKGERCPSWLDRAAGTTANSLIDRRASLGRPVSMARSRIFLICRTQPAGPVAGPWRRSWSRLE